MPARSTELMIHRLRCEGCELRAKNYNRGFSLVEILIVLVILAIVAVLALPMAGSGASMQIRSAANMITADLEYAKSMAITGTQIFSVDFDSSQESYQIEDQGGDVISHPVKKGFDYVVNLADEGLTKVDIVDANFDSTSIVKFDYLGSPYNGSDNPLNSGVITLQADGVTMTIEVEPVTGFISITD